MTHEFSNAALKASTIGDMSPEQADRIAADFQRGFLAAEYRDAKRVCMARSEGFSGVFRFRVSDVFIVVNPATRRVGCRAFDASGAF